MKRLLLILTIAALAIPVYAQNTAKSKETVTFAGTAVGFTSTTLNFGDGTQARRCYGKVETAQIRYFIDGSTPTASVGIPGEVGEFITISGGANLMRFLGIRTGSTSGVIQFVCEG